MEKKKKSKAAEYKEKLKAIEAEEQRLSKLPSKLLKEVLGDITKIEYVQVPGQDYKLAYKRIRLKDFVDIQKLTDRMEIVHKMLFYMLKGADKAVTEAEVGAIPFDVASEIMAEIMKKTPFLETPTKTSPP